MKRLFNFISRTAFAVLCLALTGCQTHKPIVHLKNGYEEVKHPTHSFLSEDEPPRISFEFQGADDKTILVWPSLYGVKEVVKNDLAIFVGDKAAIADGSKEIHARLFAVKSPELPLDITDEVLWRWSKANGKSFSKTLQKFNLVTPQEVNGQLELHLDFLPGDYLSDDDWPDSGDLQLDWKQVSEIMRSVQQRGVLENDLRWHTPYIGEKF
jgi:hypothetical protein